MSRVVKEVFISPKLRISSVLFRPFTSSTGVAALAVRLVVGYGFIQHGFAKVLNGPDLFAANLSGLGVPAPEVMSWITISSELTCGLAVLVGALIPLTSIPMAIILIVAMLYVHLPYGFSSIKLQAVTPEGIKFGPPGYEVILLYLVCILTLTVLGAGPLSVDSWLTKRLSQPK